MPIRVATIRAADVPASQTDFPFFIDPARVGTSPLTLAEINSSRWYTDTDLVTQMAREIVSVSEAHGKYASLTNTSKIAIDYDGIRADYAVSDTFGRNNVWTNGYVGVWHMGEASGNALSSTGNNTGVDNNTVGTAAGKIGNGRDFIRSSSEYFSIANADQTGLGITGNAISMSAWVKGDSTLNNLVARIFWRLGGAGSLGYQLSTTGSAYSPNNAYLISAVGSGGGTDYAFGTAGDATNGVLKHIVATYDGTNFRGYVNTAKNTSGTLSNRLTGANALPFYISGNLADYYDDVLDECRIRSVVSSDNWITTEYNNQNDEAAFWGTWTTFSGGGFTPTPLMHMRLMAGGMI